MNSVIMFVFDGLQPAQVTTELMPNLHRFAAEGVTFTRHHSVFPTVTRANAASIVTGCGPGRHGLSANRLMVRDYDPNEASRRAALTLMNWSNSRRLNFFLSDISSIKIFVSLGLTKIWLYSCQNNRAFISLVCIPWPPCAGAIPRRLHVI